MSSTRGVVSNGDQRSHQFICFVHRWCEVLWTNAHVFNDFEVNSKALLTLQSQREVSLKMPSSPRVLGI